MNPFKCCSHCKQTLPLEQFYKNRSTSDGHTSECANCAKERARKQRATPTWKAYQKAYDARRKEKHRQQMQEWFLLRKEEAPFLAARKKYARQYRVQLRDAALAAYGNKCTCCGETQKEFLAFDHIEGGGKRHRDEVGAGPAFYKWLRDHDYPPTIQLLCHNCNMAKGFYGQCPHQQGCTA